MKYDVVIVGGGHAGIEAANIVAKRGLSTLLITSNIEFIGHMSCNPAIGGIAKGNIVREIDALGGLMGKIIDKTGIHFKMLNQTKGMAVWGNRAQADKWEYKEEAKKKLEELTALSIFQGFVKSITAKDGKIKSVILDNGECIEAIAVVLTMGTFLNGVGHIGLNSFECGRLGEPSSKSLTESISSYGIEIGRLKTGTSPRIDGRTVDFSELLEQKGDEKPWPFSFSTMQDPINKTSCWITKTNKQTHSIIMGNLDKSPLYTGKIKSIGPRYCPSIEDKVVRFGERDGHTLFLEPEGLGTHEMYLNGLSTSLPLNVQIEMVRSVSGLSNAKIMRPGYGIEYDYFPPEQLKLTLESKKIENLFFAGQINGTSGYEEAACQGVIAGINASEKVLGGKPFVLTRDLSYTGVLIDDLVTKGTKEPYRMFTSRAENRLELRQDNTDERLMPLALEKKLVDEEVFEIRKKIWEEKKELKKVLNKYKISPKDWHCDNNESNINVKTSAYELLKRPNVFIQQVCQAINLNVLNRDVMSGVEADIKYEGFIGKSKEHGEKFRRMENEAISESIDYELISGLLTESKLKLNKIKPKSLGQALRIPGVTPADIGVIMVYLSKQKHVSRETTGLL